MAQICRVHPYEAAEGLCRSCGGPFCADCLVFPFGPAKPPLCVPCAVTAGGVRKTARNPRVVVPKESKRQLKEWRKARKRDLASPPPDGVATWQQMDAAEAETVEEDEFAAAEAQAAAEREALRLPPPPPEEPEAPPPGINIAPPGSSHWQDEIEEPLVTNFGPPGSSFDAGFTSEPDPDALGLGIGSRSDAGTPDAAESWTLPTEDAPPPPFDPATFGTDESASTSATAVPGWDQPDAAEPLPPPPAWDQPEPESTVAPWDQPVPGAWVEPETPAAAWTEPETPAAAWTEPETPAAAWTEPETPAAAWTEPEPAGSPAWEEPTPIAASWMEPEPPVPPAWGGPEAATPAAVSWANSEPDPFATSSPPTGAHAFGVGEPTDGPTDRADQAPSSAFAASPLSADPTPNLGRPAIRPSNPTRIPASPTSRPKPGDAQEMLDRIAALRSAGDHD